MNKKVGVEMDEGFRDFQSGKEKRRVRK